MPQWCLLYALVTEQVTCIYIYTSIIIHLPFMLFSLLLSAPSRQTRRGGVAVGVLPRTSALSGGDRTRSKPFRGRAALSTRRRTRLPASTVVAGGNVFIVNIIFAIVNFLLLLLLLQMLLFLFLPVLFMLSHLLLSLLLVLLILLKLCLLLFLCCV